MSASPGRRGHEKQSARLSPGALSSIDCHLSTVICRLSSVDLSWYPWQDSNLRFRLRRPAPYPLGHRGTCGVFGISGGPLVPNTLPDVGRARRNSGATRGVARSREARLRSDAGASPGSFGHAAKPTRPSGNARTSTTAVARRWCANWIIVWPRWGVNGGDVRRMIAARSPSAAGRGSPRRARLCFGRAAPGIRLRVCLAEA